MHVSRETAHRIEHTRHRVMTATADWLAERAAPLGFTNFRTPTEVLEAAMVPAASVQDLLGHQPSGAWADLGAGSGALGLALAILYPSVHVALVDRRASAVALIDLTIRHLAVPNATSLLLDLSPANRVPRWHGVVLRAFSQPDRALAIAAAYAERWVCVFHSPAMSPYSSRLPSGFAARATIGAGAQNLSATLYERR